MAILIPDLEKAKAMKQKPTAGELYLLEFLEKSLSPTSEVFFQPCFNGDRPDVVIMEKGLGVIVIEVKDWNLDLYSVNEQNKWVLKQNGKVLKSPCRQAYDYKKNFFEMHVNGLLEKNIKNPQFFGLIKTYVYFHNGTKAQLVNLYGHHLEEAREALKKNETDLKQERINQETYDKRRLYWENRRFKFDRDMSSTSLTRDKLHKISFPQKERNILFEDSIYQEFRRLLCPPFHYADEGKPVVYSAKQAKLIQSAEGARQKIGGLAGSGKTVVLAGRAVNAHKRHGGQVLILSYNITLWRYIHDKVSAVREDFPWGSFQFSNYHRFMTVALNNSGIDIVVPKELRYEGTDKRKGRAIAVQLNTYLEAEYYSNESIFDGAEVKTKYGTILLDEVQDYKPEWIRLLRSVFLEEGGEMVLFGDEKQNIYGRPMDGERRSKVVEGFGKWTDLTKSFRYKESSPIIPLAERFQKSFLIQLYNVDQDESYQMSLSMVSILGYGSYDDPGGLAGQIIGIAKRNSIHPNDISIISSQEAILQDLDELFRQPGGHNERTLCTFPTLEFSKSKFSHYYKKLSAAKKFGFNLNSGVMKLASIHSFKGFESPLIVLIVNDGDSPEIILTGLTRAKEHLVVYVQKESKYFDFFSENLESISTFLW
ncbi:NERD domain-containing protein [Variovorax boronicumulans]